MPGSPELEINAKEFVETLNVLSSIIHPKETELARKQVLIDLDNNILLKTVNESTLLSATCNGTITNRGQFCVNANYLINLLSKFNGNVKISMENDKIHIKAGSSKYSTTSFPVEDFLPLTHYNVAENLEFHNVDLNSFKESLTCVYSSASKDNTTPLSSTYIAHNHMGDKDCIVCSNSELGAAVVEKNLISIPQGPIPRFIVDFILKLKDLRILEFAVQDGLFIGKSGRYTFVYRSPEFEYPWDEINSFLENYHNMENGFKFFKNDMVNALNRISVVADEDTHAVQITFGLNSAQIVSSGPGNYGAETIPLLENNDRTYQITVDSIYLISVLKELEGNLEWHCEDNETPQFISDGHLIKFFMGLSGE